MNTGPVGGPGRGHPDLLAALKSGRVQGGEKARIKAAAQLLEGQFYQELFKAMRDTIPQDGLMGGGEGEEMFTSMLDQQIAEAAAGQSERGIGAALYRHFVKHVAGGADEAAPELVEALPTDESAAFPLENRRPDPALPRQRSEGS